MNLCSNSEGQRDPKLNEYRQVADRVRGAGRRDHQEIGKRESDKPTLKGHNGDGNEVFISPTPSSGGNLSTKDLLARPVQGPDLNSHKTNTFLPGSTHLWDKNSNDQAPAPSVSLEEQTKYPKGRGEARKNQSRNDGRTGKLFTQHLRSSEVPKEEQAHCEKRPTKPKGTREAPEGRPRNDGKTSEPSSQRLLLSEAPDEEMAQADKSMTELSERRHLSQVPPSFSPFLSSSVSFSNATKRKPGRMVPSAETPEVPEALGAKNAQKKQTTPHVRE